MTLLTFIIIVLHQVALVVISKKKFAPIIIKAVVRSLLGFDLAFVLI